MAGAEHGLTPTPEQLLAGYGMGVFPMATTADDPELHWYDPPRRGVLPIGGVHASQSLLRRLRRGGWSATLNGDFAAALAGCAAREETWINAPLTSLYRSLNRRGHCHSLEVWFDGNLAGGLFGVTLGGAFFGESMFSARTDASKLALLWLSSQLRRCGFTLLDTQFLTPHLASLGGREIARNEYYRKLHVARALNVRLKGPLPDAQALWQEITQTS